MGNPKKFQSYAEKLRHPNWQRKRLEVLDYADFTCQSCGDTENTLHVHHRWYLKGREPWEYDNDQLSVLCGPCHADAHIDMATLSYVVSNLPVGGEDYLTQGDIAYLLAGMFMLDMGTASERERKLYKFGFITNHRFINEVERKDSLLTESPEVQ